jgi:hypothetical protein
MPVLKAWVKGKTLEQYAHESGRIEGAEMVIKFLLEEEGVPPLG